MKLNGRQIVGGLCFVSGSGAYVWLMAAALVPTAVGLAANFGVSATAPGAWIGLTAAALAFVLGVDRGLLRKR